MKKLTMITSVLAASVLALTACGASNEGTGSTNSGGGSTGNSAEVNQDWANCTPGQEAKDVSSMEVDSDKEIKLSAFNGWDESFAATGLLKNVLEKDGYTVSVDAFDAGPGYTAVGKGDVDIIMDAWLPLTHADYVKELGDQIAPAGCWYNNAKLTVSVNEDSPAKTIADLKTMGDEYNNTVYGIEAGAGLTKTFQDSAMDKYQLDNIDFKISSTPAMLAQLKKSTDAGENVAVTLWRPHWAYDAFPVRDLEDPEGAMGGAEVIYNFTTAGFGDEHPYVEQLLKNLVLNDETLSSLENVMFSDENYGGDNQEQAIEEWLGDNPDFVENWKAGKLAS